MSDRDIARSLLEHHHRYLGSSNLENINGSCSERRKITRHCGFFYALVPEIFLRNEDKNGGEGNDPTTKVDFYHVFFFLGIYLVLGCLCFFLVRHQMKGKKTIAIFDAIYFCVVTMTTLGYGDLVPDSDLSKFLSIVLVFAGMALIGFTLSKAADVMLQKQEDLFLRTFQIPMKLDLQAKVEEHKMESKFIFSLFLLLVVMIVGVVFLNQIEKLNLVDSIYCVCATITSLGYGDKSFSTEKGRIFASLWILISTLYLGQTLYYLVDLYADRRRRSFVTRVITRKLTRADLEAADLDKDKVVSVAEFIVYKLKEVGRISDDDIEPIIESFNKLDVDNSGTLTEDDFISRHNSSFKLQASS